LEVPADVDIVIEGYVDPSEPLALEGPFGDHTGFYSLEDYYPRLHVTCITHRRHAIYPATLVGIPPQEDAYIGKATERIFLSPIRLAMLPEIVDMHLPFEGVAHNIALVKIKKTYPGQARKTANALWGAGQMMFNKMLVVVDEDVELTDYAALCGCLLRHFNPTTDAYFGSGPLDVLDHAAQACGYGGKMCIDATRKLTEERPFTINHLPLTIYQLTHSFLPNASCLIQVIFDDNVNLADTSTCVWLLGNNVDPARDCRVENGMLVIDATSKRKGCKGFTRDFPNVVCAAPETIKAVDEKWERLGLGELIPSPSLRYSSLQRGSGAVSTGS
jgi:4-hydroxy-3-polyprenylbenzoate decarboxylase